MVIQENSGLARGDRHELRCGRTDVETLDRFVLFPIKHDDVWQTVQEHAASFWTARRKSISTKTRRTGMN